MIAPRPGLVGWGTVIVLPLTILATLLPGWRTLTLPPIALFVVVALLDLLWNWRKHRDLEFVVPDTIRTIAGRSFPLSLHLAAASAHSGIIRTALALPSSLSMTTSNAVLKLQSKELPPAIALELRAEVRGIFLVSRQLARFLKRNEVGIHHYRHLGRGREFEKLREYEPGDGFDTIHWKATAKRRYPITKVYQTEKAQEVYVALDSSRLSGRLVENEYATTGSTGGQIPTLERTIASSLLFCAAAQSQGDLFGLLTFSDRIDHLVTARSGPAHFNRCRDVLAGLQTRLVSPDFGEIASTLMGRIKRRALIVFLTSLDDPVLSEAFLSSMDFVARRHLVLAVMLLAPSVRPLFSLPGVEKIDDIYQNIAGHLRWTHLTELRRQLHQRGIQFCLVSNKSVSLEVVSQYIALKRRQAL